MTSETLQPRESKQISVLRSLRKKATRIKVNSNSTTETAHKRCLTVSFQEAITKQATRLYLLSLWIKSYGVTT